MLQTCEQLLQNGFLQSKVYTIDTIEESDPVMNDNNRDFSGIPDPDFRQRFCDQSTSGGGWTVIASMQLLVLVIFACIYV